MRAPGRSCGSAAATRVSIAHTSSGGSSTENTVVTEIDVLPGGRLRLVNDAAASTEFGMICSPLPVSICVARQLTSTTRPRADGVSTQSPMLERLLEQQQQPGDDLADRVLQRQAEDDRGDAQRGEQAADVGAPDVGEDDRQADGDQQEPRDVEEDRRNPFAPGAFRRALEQGRVEPRQQQHQHHEAEHRGDDPDRRASAEISVALISSSSSAPSGSM